MPLTANAKFFFFNYFIAQGSLVDELLALGLFIGLVLLRTCFGLAP